LHTPSKRQHDLNHYKPKGYCITCLQNTHFTIEVEAQWGYKCVFNSYASNSRAVAFRFNNFFNLKLHREKKDNNENFLALDLYIDDNRITVIHVNIYGSMVIILNFRRVVENIYWNLIIITILYVGNLI
jgi:hypothetical protein